MDEAPRVKGERGIVVTAVVLVAVVALILGASLGWLARSRRCRHDHAHLVRGYDEGDLDTFLGTEPSPEPPPDPSPVAADQPAETDGVPHRHAALVPGAFPGSVLPGPGGAAPAPDYVVKAKASSRIYHTAGSPSYARTRAEVWFRSPEDAEAAGFRAPRTASRRSAPE